MEHQHHYNPPGHNRSLAFKFGIGANVVFIVVEVVYGLISNSMALLADAGHNFSDVLTLAFSWLAVVLSQRRPTQKFTYGFRRSTILIALLNTMFLLVAVGVIVWETIGRIGRPLQIDAGSVITVAAVGIIVNGFTAWLFVKGKKQDLNIRSAFLHFLFDALVSFGVVVAGILMALTGITWIDSLVSFLVVTVILYSTYRLLVDSVSLAMDAVPGNISIGEVREYLESLGEVSDVHDLHIWALSTTDAALTVHLVTNQPAGFPFITTVQHQLSERFGIRHATIQVEFGAGTEDCDTNCHP